MRNILTIILLWASVVASADALDSLQEALRDRPQIQERIYVQTDNNCYFVGDTLWYKAFVLRADSLKPTHLSKLLYVELLTPDGYLVSRNRHVIAPDGTTNGQFFLKDSLYSGYYEVRAYTKWQLNFNETVYPHSTQDRHVFYNKEFQEAFFRKQEGLYSRVLPVYEKPMRVGEYDDKRIIPRPKQRAYQDKPDIKVTFYPEGGQLVSGLDSQVAFEVTDNDGQGLSLTGVIDGSYAIRSQKDGRGLFPYSASKNYKKVTFSYNNKDYTFELPEVQPTGCVINYDHKSRKVKALAQGVTMGAMSITCRGKLRHFDRITSTDYSLDLSNMALPTGINEVIIYDNNAQPLASRLFFVNNNDRSKQLTYDLKASDETLKDTTKAAAYAPLALQLKGAAGMPSTFCVSVRDNNVEELSYDDGNIMTDFLLSGELKGFVANPAQYFPEKEEQKVKAQENLDLLMMVQGWRRYKRVTQLRYLPERNLTFEGQVLNVPSSSNIIDLDYITGFTNAETTDAIILSPIGYKKCKSMVVGDSLESALGKLMASGKVGMSMRLYGAERCDCMGDTNHVTDPTVGDPIYTKPLKNKQIMMEAEIIKGTDVGSVTAAINDKGFFKVNIPPYYDEAVFMLTAYQNKDSLKKALTSTKNRKRMDETAYPDYYVKQDVFYPQFTEPYSWYQHNAPDDYDYVDDENIPAALQNNRIEGDHYLQNVVVRKRRKMKKSINWEKPTVVIDAYQLYNEMTDYGISHGVLDMIKFPMQATTYLFGYLGEANEVKVRGLIEVQNELLDEGDKKKHSPFFRNYVVNPTTEVDIPMSKQALYEQLHLNRMLNIRAYTDYDKRNGTRLEIDGEAAVTLVIEPIPDNGKRYTYRDRRYILDGITYPEEFYSPDYSQQKPAEPTDYRRTLYWNPNAKPAEDGTFHATFYNNSRPTRLVVNASGIDTDGNFYFTK